MRSRTPSIGELLAVPGPLLLPGVWDSLSARLAEEAGFRALFLSGFAVSVARFGVPDLGLVTQTEMLEAARQVCAAVRVPVVVDADTGYGGPANVERTVDALLRAGAAGCFLEDQVWPKRCGHLAGKQVVPVEEYLLKLRAALSVRAGTSFHVTARTDARAPLGLDGAIARARAYAEAGADAVFVEAPESEDEMTRIRRTLPPEVTLVANMVEGGRTPLRSAGALAEAGFRMVVVPLAGLLATAQALGVVFETLRRDGATAAVADRLSSFAAVNELVGLERLLAHARAMAR